MKPLPAIIVLIIASTAFAHGEQEKIPTPRSPTPARILGDIPDGTPPPPAPPEPPFIVAKRDIVSTTTHPQGGRTITVRQIKPIALPAPPEVAPSSPATDAAVRAQIAHYRTTHPKNEAVFLSAKVYRSNNAPPRSLVQYSLLPSQEKITFWSNADFALIAGGIQSFADSAGHNHSIFMSWGNVDFPLRTDLKSSRIREAIPPQIPDFPDGKATFQISGKQPAAADLIAIQSLHAIYNKDYERLLTAFQGRERARLQQQAYLKAHPPKPKNITLNYWRTETPSDAAEGGKP